MGALRSSTSTITARLSWRASRLVEIYSPTLLQAEREYRATPASCDTPNVALRLRQMGLTPAQIAALPAEVARHADDGDPRAHQRHDGEW